MDTNQVKEELTDNDCFYLLDDFNYPLVIIPSVNYVNMLSEHTLWTHTIMHASLNLYGGRVHFTKKKILLQFFGEAGLDEGVLIRLIRANAKGLPLGVTEKSVKEYWRNIGPDSTKLLASITKLRQVERDYDIPMKDLLPNQSITIDQFHSQISMVKNTSGRAEVIPALNGDTKVLICVDTKSGSVRQYTRKTFSHPELLLENIIDDYGTLIEIWADDSFVTIESLAMCKRRRVTLHQFVPGQHNIYGGRVEGIGRWIKEGAQTCWNKILEVIKLGKIQLLNAKRLWRHCWIFAVQVINLRPCLHDKSIMRFFFVYGRQFSLINDCMMPFMTPLIVYKLLPTETGRGAQVYYLCRSQTVGTGIVVFDPITNATSVVAPFKVYTHDANKGTPAELTEVATELHGRFAPVTGVTATAAIPLSSTPGVTIPVITPGVAGGGFGTSAVEKTVKLSDSEDNAPSKRSIKRAQEEAKQKAIDAAAIVKRDGENSKRDLRKKQQSIVAEAVIKAKDDEDDRIAKELNASRSGGVSTNSNYSRPATIEEASAKFRSRLKNIQEDREDRIGTQRSGLRSHSKDKRDTVLATLGPYEVFSSDDSKTVEVHGLGTLRSGCGNYTLPRDDKFLPTIQSIVISPVNSSTNTKTMFVDTNQVEEETNDLIRLAVNEAISDYSYILERVFTSHNDSEPVSGYVHQLKSVIFDTDPGGVHSQEDQALVDEFALNQIACVIGEEIEFSEHRMYLEDLIGDYNVLNEIQAKEEAVEEARLDITDPTHRPPIPTPPGPSARKSDVLWQKALRREIDKLQKYDVMHELPKDANGKYIYPKDAIVQRLLEVAEYKWKKDPDTQLMRWLECIRIVVDGSKDLRPDSFYALTPDRTILFVILAIVATLGHPSETGDVERAYLNAVSLDKNLVVLAGNHMAPLAPANLLDKGLYGAKRAALGFEYHIDGIMDKLGYQRLQIARGVYLKYDQETGDLIRAYRHSDDFYLTSSEQVTNKSQGDLIRGEIGMSPFVVPYTFLGLECERLHHLSGLPDPLGKLILLRQTAKIEQAEAMFEPAFEKYFPRKDRQVTIPVPLDYNLDVALLSPLMARPCDAKEKLLMQSVVGTEIWLTSSVHRWGTFATYVSASSTSTPTIRDLYNALYHLKFLIQEKHTPLVLGGNYPIEVRGTADCSLGTGKKGKSVLNYNGSLNEFAGAIGSFTTSTNFALCNISHGETEAMVKCTHLLVYVTNVLKELGYLHNPDPVLVQGDNQASINWVHGGPTSNLSRHFNLRIMAIRTYCEKHIAAYEHIATELNTADIGTKAMGPGLFNTHARNIQGHRLLDCLPNKHNIRGFKEIATPKLKDDLEQIIDTLSIDSGMGLDFDISVLSEILHMEEEEQFINEINWTVNDYSLAHAYLFRLDVSSAEEQPLLIITNEDGSIPSLSSKTNN